jgi:signal transduction histidine kinase
LDIHLSPDMGPVKVDAKLFSEVILNLLSNAIKYSPPETKVTLDLREEGNRVILEVRDQGIGIPKKHLARIFDKFYRVKDERAQEERGTGLGLSLVREIVEMHRGHIEVESTVGVGSVFRVILPRQSNSSAKEEREEKADAAGASVIDT